MKNAKPKTSRIMVVEDEFIVAEDLRNHLIGAGHEVTAVVDTGEEAVTRAEADRPDIILMDVILAGTMDGVEAARTIHTFLNIPIIFLTAHSNAEIVERAKLTEPLGYVLKPFDFRELAITIELALYKAEMEAKLRASEEALLKAHFELEKQVRERTAELEDANTALRVLLQHRDEERRRLEEGVMASVKRMVIPHLERLVESRLTPEQRGLVSLIESNLGEITSQFATRLSSQFVGLTPKEIEVAGMVRDGKTSDEIARVLGISENAVAFHRKSIRRKLGIKRKKVNLRSYLQHLPES